MSVQIKVYQAPEDVRVFGEDAVVKVRLRQNVDLMGGGLPEVNLEAIVRSDLILQAQHQQKIELYWGTWLQATVYASECTRLGDRLYRLRGKRRLEYLQTEYLGGIYEGMPPDQLLDQLLEDKAYELAIPLTGENITGYLPRCNRQEALRQITVALGGMICATRQGQLWLRAPEYEDPLVLESGQILGDYPLQMLPEYTRFELAAHSYTKGQFEVKLKDRVEYPAGPVTIYVGAPHYNYYTDPQLGDYVEEEGPNYAVVQHSGVITLFAYPYIKETTYHTLPGAGTEDPEYSLVQTVRDVTLVNEGNVEALLQRMKEMGQLRLAATVTYGVGPDEEIPLAGDPVELPTAWGTKLKGYVKKSNLLAENGTFKLELTVVCKEETE